MILAASLPVAWLIGRRTAPSAQLLPLLVGGRSVIALPEGPGGLASGGGMFPLPPPADPRGAYRLSFYAAAPGRPARPPYRLRLEGPDGGDLWQGTWTGTEGDSGPLELVVPVILLRQGKHALRIEDAAGLVRSYPFLVP